MYYIIYINYILHRITMRWENRISLFSSAHSIALSSDSIATRRDAATPYFWRRWLSMCYKMQRGNATKKSLRFHAISKMVSDYQWVTKCSVAASRASYSPKNIWRKLYSFSMHKHVLIVDDQSFEWQYKISSQWTWKQLAGWAGIFNDFRIV